MKKDLDKSRCKQSVFSDSCFNSYQCSRKIWKDGFCKQHHPDTIAERRDKSEQKFREQQKKSPWRLLKKAKERITELEAELAEIHRLSGIIDSACNSRTNNLT